ncbi:MAG: hypothetical protein WBO95_01350 [Candidatus Dechloromonas phosphoritropha]|jgi:hypothetical protein
MSGFYKMAADFASSMLGNCLEQGTGRPARAWVTAEVGRVVWFAIVNGKRLLALCSPSRPHHPEITVLNKVNVAHPGI